MNLRVQQTGVTKATILIDKKGKRKINKLKQINDVTISERCVF